MQRIQTGLTGLFGIVLLIGLANIVVDTSACLPCPSRRIAEVWPSTPVNAGSLAARTCVGVPSSIDANDTG